MLSFVTDFFQLALCVQDIYIWWHVLHSFLQLNNILLYGYTFCLSICQLMWTFRLFHFSAVINNMAVNVHKFCMNMFSFLLDIYLGVKLLGRMVTQWVSRRKYCLAIFRSSCTVFHSRQQSVKFPVSPYPCQLLLSIFWVVAILIGVRWYLIVVLICISPMTKMLSIFPCACQ